MALSDLYQNLMGRTDDLRSNPISGEQDDRSFQKNLQGMFARENRLLNKGRGTQASGSLEPRAQSAADPQQGILGHHADEPENQKVDKDDVHI